MWAVAVHRFGGWAGSQRADPLLGAMLTANTPLLVMDSDPARRTYLLVGFVDLATLRSATMSEWILKS